MDDFSGKTIFITGAGNGIGRATAVAFARAKANIILTDIDKDSISLLAKQIVQEFKTKCLAVQMDVTNKEQVDSAVAKGMQEFVTIDVLVNNAGISGASKHTHEITEQEWDKVMAVNVKGVFFCTKHAIPYMQKTGGGSIINLSSIYGIISAPDVPPYHASKGAIRLMTKTDALLYAKDKIRVNSVHPGFIMTPMVENYLKASGNFEEGLKYLNSLHPSGHVGEADDIAYGILYLASDESKFVTGSELVIDGGYTAR